MRDIEEPIGIVKTRFMKNRKNLKPRRLRHSRIDPT